MSKPINTNGIFITPKRSLRWKPDIHDVQFSTQGL